MSVAPHLSGGHSFGLRLSRSRHRNIQRLRASVLGVTKSIATARRFHLTPLLRSGGRPQCAATTAASIKNDDQRTSRLYHALNAEKLLECAENPLVNTEPPRPRADQ